jgi:hypothetical protein
VLPKIQVCVYVLPKIQICMDVLPKFLESCETFM